LTDIRHRSQHHVQGAASPASAHVFNQRRRTDGAESCRVVHDDPGWWACPADVARGWTHTRVNGLSKGVYTMGIASSNHDHTTTASDLTIVLAKG